MLFNGYELIWLSELLKKHVEDIKRKGGNCSEWVIAYAYAVKVFY